MKPSFDFHSGDALEHLEPRLLLSGTWSSPISIDYGDSGQYCDIAFRDDGTMAMAYYDPSLVSVSDADLVFSYLKKESDGYSYSGITDWLHKTGDEGKWPSIALGTYNEAHISYYDVSSGDLRYVTYTESWSTAVTVDSAGNVGEYTRIALDSSQNPHIIYYDRTNTQLKYAYYDGASWHIEAVAGVGSVSDTDFPRVNHLASLAIDYFNTPHVSFYDKTTGDLKYAVRTGGGWVIQTVDSTGNVGVDNALALDSSAHPHIAYFDYTNTDIRYAVYNGSTWDIETVNNTANYAGEAVDMVLDGADYPHISYKDQTANKLGYAYQDAGGWHLSTLDSEDYTGQQTSIAMDADGNVVVTYRKDLASDKKLKLVYGTGIGVAQPPDAPDLAVQVDLPAGQQWLPGDKTVVPVVVTNVGNLNASGPIWVELYASEDTVLDGGDIYIDDLDASVNLSSGQSQTFKFLLVIPPYAQPGEYYFIAQVTPDLSVGDANAGNDTNSSDAPAEVVWKFGNFDPARQNTKLMVTGMDVGQGDVPVTFVLTGGGEAEIVGGDQFDQIVLKNTTEKSTLKIVTKGGMLTSIGTIIVEGSLGALDAKTATIRGNVIVGGTLKNLTLGNVDAAHTISINDDGVAFDPKKMLLTATLGSVYDADFDTHGIPIKSLTVAQWCGGTITAPWIGNINSKGDKKTGASGDFNVSLMLDGSGDPKLTLGNVKVADDASTGEWNITGNVGNVTIAGDLDDMDLKSGGDVKSIKVGDVSGCQLDIDGALGTFQAGDVQWSGIGADSIKSFKAGYFADSEVEVDGAVGTFMVGDWNDSDLGADSLNTLKAGSFHRGRFYLAGKDVVAGKPVLNSAKVGNITDSAEQPDDRGWEINGPTGAVSTGIVTDWRLRAYSVKKLAMDKAGNVVVEVLGAIGSVQAVSWDTGRLEGGTIGSVSMIGNKKMGTPGSFSYAEIIATGQGALPGKPVIGKLSIPVMADNLTIEANGNVGSVSVGFMHDSQLLLGSQGLSAGDRSDFSDGAGGTNEFALKSLTLTGYVSKPGEPASFFESSSVGAWNIGTVKFAQQPAQASGKIEYNTLGKITNAPLLGAPPDPFDLIQVI